MIGRLSVIPYDANAPKSFNGTYSYCKICLGDLVWTIAMSPVVKEISSVKKLKGVGNLEATLVYHINGQIIEDLEVMDLGYEALGRLGSQGVFDLLKKVERWELGG